MKEQIEARTYLDAIITSPDGALFYFLDPDYNFISFSNSFARIIKTNWGTEIKIGMSVFEIKDYIIDTQKTAETFGNVLQGDSQNAIYDYFQNNHLKLSVECTYSPFYKENVIIGIYAYVQDNTEKRKVEEAIRLSSKQQSVLSLPLIFYTGSLNPGFNTTWISDQVETITGFKPEMFITNPCFWSDNLHPDDQQSAVNEYNSILEKGFIAIEYRWRCADGVYRWFLDQISLSYDNQQNPTNLVGVWMDITQRKIKDEKLQKSELKYRQLFDNANDVIIIFEPESEIILEANKAACKTYGFQPEELIGMSLKKLTKNVTEGEHQIQELIKRGIYHDFESVQFNKNGEEIYFLINSTTIDYNGRKAVLSLNRNITDKKKAETALREIAESYTGLFNSVTEAIYIQDENGYFIDVNVGVEKMYGYRHEEIIGKGPEFLAAPDKNDMEQVSYFVGNTFLTGKSHKFEFWGRRKNGEIFPKDVCLNKGKFAGKDVIITTARDVSERKKAEQALIESETWLKLAIETGKLGIWEWNTSTGQLKVNSYFYEMFGYENQEFEPAIEKIVQFIYPEDLEVTTAIIQNHITEKTASFETEQRFMTKSGNYKWIRTYGKVIERHENGEPLKMAGTIIDVDNLKSLTIQLQEINFFKDRLMSVIAHDLRSPFNSILGFSQLVADNIQTYEVEKSRKYIMQINTSAKHTLSLLDTLIDWYKTQTGAIVFNPQLLNLKTIIEEIVNLCSSSAKIKNVVLEKSISESLTILADEAMIKTILRNLIYNSIKFTNSGGKVLISSSALSDSVQITVADNGIGISEEKLKSIFSENANFSSTGTSNETGFGLGLRICKDFIDMHQGKIHIESRIGEGTSFNIEFPDTM
jgi:PAS domain S-box-containing protein